MSKAESNNLKILLINGYSAANRGDGLLVSLAADLVREAFPKSNVEVVAAVQDRASFDNWEGFTAVQTFDKSSGFGLVCSSALANLTRGRRGFSADFRRALVQADLVLSVGGAYHRGASLDELLKSALVHGTQARTLAGSGRPWILLPQSIGPLPAPYAWLLKRWLKKADVVFARDDTTVKEIRLPNIQRVPDCAILAIPGSRKVRRGQVGHGVALVVRDLRRAPRYRAALALLVKRKLEWFPLVQSSISGNDDRPFYESLGLDVSGELHDALASEDLGAVVSVRLHGALESLLEGVPAVHLSYERKGYSAYKDLGIPSFVFDARDFDPLHVAERVEELLKDPSEYWKALRRQTPRIRSERQRVVVAIRSALERPDPGF